MSHRFFTGWPLYATVVVHTMNRVARPAKPRYTSSVINASVCHWAGRSRDSRCPLLIGRCPPAAGFPGEVGVAWQRLVNKSTCPSISHRTESPGVVESHAITCVIIIITLTLTPITLTHYCDYDNDNNYDIAAWWQLKYKHRPTIHRLQTSAAMKLLLLAVEDDGINCRPTVNVRQRNSVTQRDSEVDFGQ